MYRQSFLFHHIAILGKAINHMGANYAVILCLQTVLLVESVEVTPMTPTMLALALLELLTTIDHLSEKLLAGAYVEVEDDDLTMCRALGQHADFVVAHRDLQIAIRAMHHLLRLTVEDGVRRKVVGL